MKAWMSSNFGQGPVSSIKFLGQILKVSYDIFWDVRRRPKIVLRLKSAFHQKRPKFLLCSSTGPQNIMRFIMCELIIAV